MTSGNVHPLLPPAPYSPSERSLLWQVVTEIAAYGLEAAGELRAATISEVDFMDRVRGYVWDLLLAHSASVTRSEFAGPIQVAAELRRRYPLPPYASEEGGEGTPTTA